MGAVFTPLGGGSIGKAEAFDIMAEQLCIHERPLSEVRLDVFRLVFQLGTEFQAQSKSRGKAESELWDESWALLGGLYEGLAAVEAAAMKTAHAVNTQNFLATRSAKIEAEDRAAGK